MKKTSCLFALFTISLFTIHYFAFSQSCLPEGITFTTQEEIDDFQTNYPGCTEIEGDVIIVGAEITNLNNLIILTAINGDLCICGYLHINGNALLTSLEGLDNLISIGGSLDIAGNPGLNSLEGLGGLVSVEDQIFIKYNSSLETLDGLDNLTNIGGRLVITTNPNLTSLIGMDSLRYIDGSVAITSNNILPDLTGFESIDSIGGTLNVSHNPALSSLNGLNNLSSIGYILSINFNDSLTNLTDLMNLNYLGKGLMLVFNDTLNSLEGLNNIETSSMDTLMVGYNQNLSYCDVQSVCEYLNSMNGFVLIEQNSLGCNSQNEVEDACLTGTGEKVVENNNVQIFPNPAKKTISILSSSQQKIDQIKIFNQTGVLNIEKDNPKNKIDVSSLQPGLYFVEIKMDAGIIRKKLIIE